MDETYCKYCRHFVQHYALCEGRLFRVYCGHCTHASVKTKRPDRKACEHFEQGAEDLEQFVSKTYLRKSLLEKILNMELLPEIEDYAAFTR